MQRIKRVLKWVRRAFFAIFRVPENMLFFFSGIVLSAAINVATNGVTYNGFDWNYNCRVTISMLLMFISSIFFTWMAIYKKPLDEHYKAHPIAIREGNKEKWYEVIAAKKGAILILSIFFLLTYIALATSILLLFWDDFEVLWRSIFSQKALATQTSS